MGAALLAEIDGELCTRSVPRIGQEWAGTRFHVSHLRGLQVLEAYGKLNPRH